MYNYLHSYITPSCLMSKYTKLLQPLVCEWLLATASSADHAELCGASFSSTDALTAHIRVHLESAVPDRLCHWAGCDFSSMDNVERTRHVLFHPHHCFLKLLGAELQEARSLPSCQLDEGTRNIVPVLTTDCKCLWADGKCGAQFDGVSEFFRHVHEHAVSEPDRICKWKGH